jgi:RNA polymerase-associated protein RTF1
MERDHAIGANDLDRLATIDAELADMDKSNAPREMAALLNERNRKSNMEEVRKAEARGQDERRKQQEALAKGDTSVKVDASARVKTVPRMNYDLRCVLLPSFSFPSFPVIDFSSLLHSRTATPIPGTPNGAAPPTAAASVGTPLRQKLGKIEAQVASRVQLDDDLLDF